MIDAAIDPSWDINEEVALEALHRILTIIPDCLANDVASYEFVSVKITRSGIPIQELNQSKQLKLRDLGTRCDVVSGSCSVGDLPLPKNSLSEHFSFMY